MPIGPRIGVRIGPRIGPRIGAGYAAGTPQTTLSVAITDSADPVAGGSTNFDYSVILTNTGANQANTVSVVVTCDANTTFSSASGTGWVCNNAGHTVTCTRAAAAVGAAPTITVTVTTEAAGSIMFRNLSSTADATSSNSPPATQANQATRVNFVTRDAASGIYCPATAAEWTTTLAAAGIGSGGPSAIWLFQDASGNPADVLGTFALTATGAPSYQQAVTGWSRKAITFPDANAGRLQTVSASLPDVLTNSLLVYSVMQFPAAAPAGTRNLQCAGADATRTGAELLNTPVLRARSGANVADSALNPVNATRPLVNKCDRTGVADATYTDQEKLVPVFGAPSGKQLNFGAGSNNAIAGGPLYGAAFFNGAAEISDANVKVLLQTLGWTIPWT